MSVVREAAGQLLKMFVADAVVTKGVVLVVSLVGVLTRYTIINRLVAGGPCCSARSRCCC